MRGGGIYHRASGPLSRRRWLAGACALVAGATQASAAAQNKSVAGNLPYIDAHSHVWSPDVGRWPLVNGQTRDDLKPLSFTPEELLKLAEPEGVGRVVLIQHSGYHLWDNSYLLDVAARFNTAGQAGSGTLSKFSIVGMIDDRAAEPGAKLRELLPKGVRGLRITPRIHGDRWLEGAGMESLWKCGAETGQAMCCLIDPKPFAAGRRDVPAASGHAGRHRSLRPRRRRWDDPRCGCRGAVRSREAQKSRRQVIGLLRAGQEAAAV